MGAERSTRWRSGIGAAFAVKEGRPAGEVIFFDGREEHGLDAFRVYGHGIVLQWGLFFHATFLAGAVERSRKKMGRFKRG